MYFCFVELKIKKVGQINRRQRERDVVDRRRDRDRKTEIFHILETDLNSYIAKDGLGHMFLMPVPPKC